MRRVFGIVVAILLLVVIVYLSRYWTFRLWDREGLAGIQALRPQGSLPGQWLRGTPFSTFDIIAWAVGSFLLLSIIQAIWARLFKD